MFSVGLLLGILIGAVLYREGYKWARVQQERERKRKAHRDRVREFEERQRDGIVIGRVI